MVYIVGKYSKNGWSEVRQMNAQKMVMDGYAKKFNLSKKNQEHLHMFFSPWRVPKNLIRGEIWLIVQLQENVGDLIKIIGKRPGYNPKMTRRGFLKMIDGIISMMSREINIGCLGL